MYLVDPRISSDPHEQKEEEEDDDERGGGETIMLP